MYTRGGEAGQASAYRNGEHWWEARRDVGHAVTLYWDTDSLITKPRWRLEGDDTVYFLQDPVLARSDFPATAHWERIPGKDPSQNIEITITCFDTTFPSEQPTVAPTEEPSREPSGEPSEQPTNEDGYLKTRTYMTLYCMKISW